MILLREPRTQDRRQVPRVSGRPFHFTYLAFPRRNDD